MKKIVILLGMFLMIGFIILVPKESFSGYEFITGFDNINVGLAAFLDRGIYLSEPLVLENMGEVGLKTLESRPYISDGTIRFTDETYDHDTENESNRTFLSSIEYWVVRQDLTENDTLLKTTVFPVLPLGVARIHQERLLLTEKSDASLVNNDIGQTIFFTNRNASEGNIKVFRNGVILADETENDLALDGWKHLDVGGGPGYEPDPAYQTPNNNMPMAFRIQIVNPLPGDIFTVTYTPLTSSTRVVPKELDIFDSIGGLKIVDLVGDLSARLEAGQVVLLDPPAEFAEAAKTRIYLSIILRQNTAETSLTSAVEEYTLVAGYKDETKFEED